MPKILFVTSFYHANINRWLSEAFSDYGMEVIRVGPTHFDHYGIEWEIDKRPLMTEVIPENAPLDLPSLVDKYCPDILIMWDWTGDPPCYPIANPELTKLLKERLPFIYVQHEGWENALRRKDLFNPTIAYTGMPFGVYESPCSSKSMGYKYLAGACYPKIHTPQLDYYKKYTECILMAGMYYPRPQICEALKRRGINIVWGNANVSGYVEHNHRALCTWEFSATTEFIKWRFFEAMSMGCVVISDRIMLMDKLGFIPGEHYIQYELNDERIPEVEDLYIRIKSLNDPELYTSISQKAFDFVRSKHTYEHRVHEIMGDLNKLPF